MTRRRLATAVDVALEATILGSFSSIGPVVRRSLDQWAPHQRIEGRHIIVTGATSGLGLEAATELVALGAHLHLVGRNPSKLAAVEASLRDLAHEQGGSVSGYVCDLSLLAETRRLAAELKKSVPRIDVLIHNAGALAQEFTETPEGVEQTLAVHLLAPALLTESLVEQLAAGIGRIITMTSGGLYTERFDLGQLEMDAAHYSGTVAYARAKRAQTILTASWNERFLARGITAHLVHPGWAATPGVDSSLPTFAKVMGPLLRTPSQGVDTLVWLAASAPGTPDPGKLWLDRRPRSLNRLRRTRLTETENQAAVIAISPWCTQRIAQALGQH